jgi:hypothetical protein
LNNVEFSDFMDKDIAQEATLASFRCESLSLNFYKNSLVTIDYARKLYPPKGFRIWCDNLKDQLFKAISLYGSCYQMLNAMAQINELEKVIALIDEINSRKKYTAKEIAFLEKWPALTENGREYIINFPDRTHDGLAALTVASKKITTNLSEWVATLNNFYKIKARNSRENFIKHLEKYTNAISDPEHNKGLVAIVQNMRENLEIT